MASLDYYCSKHIRKYLNLFTVSINYCGQKTMANLRREGLHIIT